MIVKGERRVLLNFGGQRELFLKLKKEFGSIRQFSKEFNIPYSTAKSYSLEKISLPEGLFERIIGLLKLGKSDLEIKYLDSNWGASIGGKKGIRELVKRYPEKIAEWRREGIRKAIKMGRHFGYLNKKIIKEPKLDEKLSEFIGVYLGDGTLTKYFIRISGDYRYDRPYFKYLSELVSDLFGISSVIRKESKSNTVNLIIYSKSVCSFLNKNFNLNFGNKIRNRTRIPLKIMNNKRLATSCFRGLIDTDGSVSRRGREGSQFCIQFVSHNKGLLSQVNEIGRDLGVFTFSDNSGTGTNRWANIVKYFETVGSSNLRHIVRFNERYNNNTIYQKEVVAYYQKDFYRGLKLPYTLSKDLVG